MKRLIRLAALLLLAPPAVAMRSDSTKTPGPYFDSASTKTVTLHETPSQSSKATWTLHREGVPLEVIGEADAWRLVRHADGVQGWIPASLLTGRRNALTLPLTDTENTPSYPLTTGDTTVALVEAGNVGRLHSCDGTGCVVSFGMYQGRLPQNLLWGVYPGEIVSGVEERRKSKPN